MHLLYYDEVKYHPPVQDSFWLGGVCASGEVVPDIEAEVNDISRDAFGSGLLAKATEFHGKEICGGRGNFKGRDLDERIEYLQRLLAIISREDVYRVYIRIIPGNISHASTPPDEIAFMYLIEQVNGLFNDVDTVGMLFGDYDEPVIGSSVASLAKFRMGGTQWRRGQDIDRIIDTVHFARSHHSRMIQLADIYLYCLQFRNQSNAAPWRKKIAEVIDTSGISTPTRSRVWPIEAQWYR